jgi:hypothetical protein
MKPDLDINASLSTIFQAVCFIDGGTEVHGENDWPFHKINTLTHKMNTLTHVYMTGHISS